MTHRFTAIACRSYVGADKEIGREGGDREFGHPSKFQCGSERSFLILVKNEKVQL